MTLGNDLIIALALAVVGALVLVAGFWSRSRRITRYREWIPVLGNILSVKHETEPKENSSPVHTYRAMYQYVHEGQTHTGQSQKARGDNPYRSGDGIQLLIDPRQSDRSIEAGASRALHWIDWVLILIGSALVVVGLGVVLFSVF